MSQARLFTLFQQSTEMYKNQDFQGGIVLLNDCLLLLPTSPILYSNRSIANFHLSNLVQAQNDLKKAIQVDYLNHIAYFNLFSVHLTNADLEKAFQNLCFSLSSLCVKVAKNEKNVSLAEKAIFYSFNNKEALSLKSLLQFERGHIELALNFLTQAWMWQSDLDLKKKMQNMIAWLSKRTKLENLQLKQKFFSGDTFKLLTSLNFLNSQRKEEVLQEMIQEFNSLYTRLFKSNQNQIKLLPQIQNEQSISKFNANLGISSQMKDDYLGQKLTTYNSKMAEDQHQNKDFSGSNIQSMNNNSDNSTYIQQQILKNEVEIKKAKEKQNIINFRIYYAQLLPNLQKKQNNFYAILKYDSEKNGISITSCQPKNHDFIQWNELSDNFKLSSSASNLEIKIYDKNLFKLQDDLLGVGWLQITQLGVANVPLMDCNHRHIANIVVGLQHCRQ